MKKITPLALAALLVLSACATVAPYGGDPPKTMTPQSIMTGRPCSGVNWSKYANVNMGPTGTGWSKTPVAPMTELSCGYKYLPSLYCADKTKCVDSTWGAPTAPGYDGAATHWVIDVLQGSVSICAQQSDRFGVGSLGCDRVVCAAVGSTPTRCVLPVQVKGQAQPQSATQIIFSALRDQTIIGAIGTAEVTDVQ